MSRVKVEFEESEWENDSGVLVEGVIATCSRCDHQTESFGTSDKSRKRCLALMREECPQNEDNFYVDPDETSGGESPMPKPAVTPWWQKKDARRAP